MYKNRVLFILLLTVNIYIIFNLFLDLIFLSFNHTLNYLLLFLLPFFLFFFLRNLFGLNTNTINYFNKKLNRYNWYNWYNWFNRFNRFCLANYFCLLFSVIHNHWLRNVLFHLFLFFDLYYFFIIESIKVFNVNLLWC